jgi:hypothetical protein
MRFIESVAGKRLNQMPNIFHPITGAQNFLGAGDEFFRLLVKKGFIFFPTAFLKTSARRW